MVDVKKINVGAILICIAIQIISLIVCVVSTSIAKDYAYLTLSKTFILTIPLVVYSCLVSIYSLFILKRGFERKEVFILLGILLGLVVFGFVLLSFGHFQWTEELVEKRKQEEIKQDGCYFVEKQYYKKFGKQPLHTGTKIFGDCPLIQQRRVSISKPSCVAVGKTKICDVHSLDFREKTIKGQIPTSSKSPFVTYLIISLLSFIFIVRCLEEIYQTKKHNN